jgi:hypothetical protein
MRFRKLRIAFSSLCVLVSEFLIVYWIGSYNRPGGAKIRRADKEVILASVYGELGISITKVGWRTDNWAYAYSNDVAEINQSSYPNVTGRRLPSKPRFRWNTTPTISYVGAPYWFLTIVAASLAAILWIRPSKRFSLRTLLIATTLVAVALGLIAWTLRS